MYRALPNSSSRGRTPRRRNPPRRPPRMVPAPLPCAPPDRARRPPSRPTRAAVEPTAPATRPPPPNTNRQVDHPVHLFLEPARTIMLTRGRASGAGSHPRRPSRAGPVADEIQPGALLGWSRRRSPASLPTGPTDRLRGRPVPPSNPPPRQPGCPRQTRTERWTTPSTFSWSPPASPRSGAGSHQRRPSRARAQRRSEPSTRRDGDPPSHRRRPGPPPARRVLAGDRAERRHTNAREYGVETSKSVPPRG